MDFTPDLNIAAMGSLLSDLKDQAENKSFWRRYIYVIVKNQPWLDNIQSLNESVKADPFRPPLVTDAQSNVEPLNPI